MKEDEKVLLQDWKEVMKEFLNPLDLIDKLPFSFEFGSENYRRVISRRNEPHVAIEIALEIVMETDMPFREFISGVRNSGHAWLAELICGHIADQDVERAAKEREEEKYMRKFLSIIAPQIKEIINGEDVAESLQSSDYGELITPGEFERVAQVSREEGNQASVRTLLMILTRKPSGWLLHFTDVLVALNYSADLVDSLKGVCSFSKAQYASCDIEQESQQKVFVHEKSQSDDKARRLSEPDERKAEFHCSLSQATSPCDTIHLKPYEEHLAKPATEGINVLIYTPFANGNTGLAALIIYSRLNHKLSRTTPKAAVLVRTVAAARTWREEIKSHLYSEQWSVDHLAGSTKATLEKSLHTSNVIIMTPKILLNALNDSSVSTVRMFELLIFDECHHAMKNDDYSEIMLHYLKEKCDRCNNMPQIVGLTNMLGKPKCSAAAVEHVMTLCSNLDARGGIVTVSLEYHDEMYHNINHREELFSSREKVEMMLLMEKAIQEVQTLLQYKKDEYMEKLDELQKSAVSKSKLEKPSLTEPQRSSTSKYEVICYGCGRHVCFDDQIVKVDGTNHTWVTKDLEQNCKKQPIQHGGTEQKAGIFCKHCDRQWGITANYKGKAISQLRADAFVFIDLSSEERQSRSAWNRLKVEIENVKFEDFLKMFY